MLYIYNAKQVKLFVCDVPIFRGLADGDFLKIEKVNDSFSSSSGADGDTVVSASGDKRWRATITLSQASPHNDQLSNIHRAQTRGLNGAGMGSFHCADQSGRSLHKGNTSYIVKPPAAAYGKVTTNREWLIEIPEMDDFVGGNTAVGL